MEHVLSTGLLRRRVDAWAIKLKVSPRVVRVQRMTRKWGSCSARGTITLAADPKRSFSQYDLKVWDGWKGDLVEPVVIGTSSGTFSIFAEHGPEMRPSFGDVPLANHFEAELEV
jgi:Protein of unknown function DUF45